MNLDVPHDVGAHRPSSWAAWRLTRGVLAALALVAVLVGLPWALLQLTRWPVSGIPSGEQIRNLPAVAAEDSTITALFTVGIWAAWALFALCVVVEILGEISGGAAAQVPGAGPVQRLARSLVASVAMTIGSIGPLGSLTAGTGGSLAAVALADASPPAVAEPPAIDGHLAPADPQGSCAPEPAIAWETLTVGHDDTPWELAERHYGDGTKWLQLWEDNRSNLQVDGLTWARQSDPIEPGWQLRIRTEGPGSSAVTESQQHVSGNDLLDPAALPVVATSAVGTPTEVTARPGDHFWKLAEDHLEATLGRPVTATEIHPYWLLVIEANQARLVMPGNANLIHPGQTFLLPALDVAAPPIVQPSSPTPEEPPASTEETPPHPTPSTSAPESSDAAPSETSRPAVDEPTRSTPTPGNGSSPTPTTSHGPAGHGDDSPVATIVGTLAAGAALAIGITRAIRQRRQRRNHRHPRSVPRPSTNPELHRQLIVAADEDAHSQLRQVMQHLGTTLAAAETSSRPRVVQQGADHIDVLLDVPAQPAGEGWQVQADGAIWSCDPTQLRGTPGSEEPTPTPLLVMLGQPDDGGQLYIDLEAEGVISLAGDLDVARGVARSLVTELAHSPFADSAQMVVVGQLGASLTRLDRVQVVEDWAAAVDDLVTWADQSRNVLAANGWASPFVARARGETHDALTPLVVVADEPPDAVDVLSNLRGIGPQGAAALVVVGEIATGATVIDCSPTALSLRELGLTCAPQLLGDDEIDALADLIDDAEDPAGEQLQLLPDPTDDWSAEGANGGAYADPPYEVLVRVLGDITVEGTKKRLTPKQTSVLAYIALHRHVTAERMGDALWPEPAKSWRRRLANTVSACRAAIGTRHLPLAEDSVYRAGPLLLTDIDLFTRRLTAAAHQPPAHAAEILRGALDLVRGPVFQYPDNERTPYAWAALENWISIWEQKVTATACHLADLYLSAGDTEQAVDLALHIHQLVPTDTDLTELLMRAQAANGDRVAVRRTYHAHLEALAQLDLDDPADSTATLYDTLRTAATA